MRENDDAAVRLRAFEFLEAHRRAHPNAMPWRVLLRGFDFAEADGVGETMVKS